MRCFTECDIAKHVRVTRRMSRTKHKVDHRFSVDAYDRFSVSHDIEFVANGCGSGDVTLLAHRGS